MGTKSTAATKHFNVTKKYDGKQKQNIVSLLPQSIEGARWVGDLKMLYRGHMFAGDQLVHLRCQLLLDMV